MSVWLIFIGVAVLLFVSGRIGVGGRFGRFFFGRGKENRAGLDDGRLGQDIPQPLAESRQNHWKQRKDLQKPIGVG